MLDILGDSMLPYFIIIGVSVFLAFGCIDSMEVYLLGIIVQGCILLIQGICMNNFSGLILVLIPIAYTLIVYFARKITDVVGR